MNHKLKSLGLAFVAVLAMSAVVASATQANFNSAAYPATITGTQVSGTITGTELTKHQFTTRAGTIQCTEAEFLGALTETQTSLTVAPLYKKCTKAGLGIDVTVNGCTFKFHTPETTPSSTVDVKTDLMCPEGKVVEIHTTGLSKCVITVGPQNNLVGIDTHNEATDVKATIDVPNIAYTIHEGKACPGKPASGNYNDGTYKGLATFQGNNGAIKVT